MEFAPKTSRKETRFTVVCRTVDFQFMFHIVSHKRSLPHLYIEYYWYNYYTRSRNHLIPSNQSTFVQTSLSKTTNSFCPPPNSKIHARFQRIVWNGWKIPTLF